MKQLLVVSGANGAVGAEVVSKALSRSARFVVGLGRQAQAAYPLQYENIAARYFQFDALGDRLPEELISILSDQRLTEISWVHAVGAFHNYDAFNLAKLTDLDKLVQTNVVSTIHALHFWLGHVIRIRRGRFVAYSSVAASRNFPFSAVFNASKTALESLVGSVSNEVLIKSRTGY